MGNRQWGGITHRWLEKFWKAGLASEIGLSLIPVYRVTSDPGGFPDVSTWTETVYGARKLSSSELEKLNAECKTSYKYAVNVTHSFIIQDVSQLVGPTSRADCTPKNNEKKVI